MATQRRSATYPFVPKSTAWLRPGGFWAVPLADGRYACGRVLQLGGSHVCLPSRAFFGGLHDWTGAAEPTSEAIAGAGFLAFGLMHIRAITRIGTFILGYRALETDGITLPTLASAYGGATAMVLHGADVVRPLPRSEWGRLPVLGVWSVTYIKAIADERLANTPAA